MGSDTLSSGETVPLCSTGCDRTCCLAEGEMRQLIVRRGNTSREDSSAIPTVPSAGLCCILEECCLQEGLGGNASNERLSTGAVQYCPRHRNTGAGTPASLVEEAWTQSLERSKIPPLSLSLSPGHCFVFPLFVISSSS